MDNHALQTLTEMISLKMFERPFEHTISFHRRLRRVAARYLPRSYHIDISWAYYTVHGNEELCLVILHELCHYHLHRMGKPYAERDAEFQSLLSLVGAPPMAKAMPQKMRYSLICVVCDAHYYRKIKTDPRRFRCGKCKGELKLYEVTTYPGSPQ